MTARPAPGILAAMFNPLAIGVTFGGLLLDLIAPRPKPRYVCPTGSRTPRHHLERYDSPPVASGVPR